jgi:UDP-N-acetyl-D-mannosaminuronate dehydrogenase
MLVSPMKRIAVFRLGCVGLPAAVCSTSKGFKIIGVDADPEKIKMINEKKNPIREPGLDNLSKRTFESRM